MKKNYPLIFAFLLLGAGTVWYLLSSTDAKPKNTLGWDRKFAVDDINQVHKVFIASRNGETTTLVRQGDHWTVNGHHKASANAVEKILEVLKDVTLKFVPPQAAIPNIVKQLAAHGIKVEAYSKSGELLKAFYVGGTTTDGRGTYFIMENSDQPMAVELPYMEGQLRNRFDFFDETWRDRSVFDYKPEEIQAVSIEYPTQRNKSFRLERKKSGGFEVTPFYPNVPAIKGPVQEGLVEGFFVNFENRLAESFDSGYTAKDSIRATIPFSIVTVKDMEGLERKATFYQYLRKDRNTGEYTTTVVERYFADINDGEDWMLTQHRVFQGIFWSYQAFFEPPATPLKN